MSIRAFRTLGPRAALTVALSLGSSWGCATGAGPSATHLSQRAGIRTAAIVVHNLHSADMHLSVVVGGTRYRLGPVETFTSRTFRMPTVIPLPSDVSLAAAAIVGDESYISPSISVRQGDTIIFTVENQPKFSSLLKH